jgi:uncharacterized Fe-S center protein
MTTDISSEGLMAVYTALGRTPAAGQNVAIKITTGEPNSNYLRQTLIGPFRQSVNGTYVECMVAYGGQRAVAATAKTVAAQHGFTPFDLMDENGTLDIPVTGGSRLTSNRVGAHFSDYQFHVVLSHFKGHAIAGYGGALKNMSIGYGSRAGKNLIHTAGGSSSSWMGGDQNAFLESMAEAAKSIVDYAGSSNYIYINVMNRLSVDCDCNGNPAAPDMHDIGILSSLDPVALDQACLDLVDTALDGASLRNRINGRNGKLTVTHAAAIGLGSLEYELVELDD